MCDGPSPHPRAAPAQVLSRTPQLGGPDARTPDPPPPYPWGAARGARQAGPHVHAMELRLTLDRALVVKDIEVTTNHAPYAPCFTVAPAYKGLIGATVDSRQLVASPPSDAFGSQEDGHAG